MHIPTLYVVFGGTLIASAVALMIAWRENPHGEGQKSWALGGLVGALATLVFSVTSIRPSFYWLNALVNPLAWLAVVLFARGARQYSQVGDYPRWVWIAFALWCLTPILIAVGAEYPRGMTICAGSFVAALFCFDLVIVLALRGKNRSPASWFLVFFFGLWGLTHSARLLLTITDYQQATYARPIDQFMTLVGILGAAASAMGFAMLTTRALRDARARTLEDLERSVEHLRGQFAALAAGDYSARATSIGNSHHMDEIAQLFNETAMQIGEGVGELENQRSVLVATQESLLDGLIVVGQKLEIMAVNRALLRLLRYSEDALVGEPLRTIVFSDDADFVSGLLDAVAQGPIRERQTRFALADGTAATLTVNASAYSGGGKHRHGVVLSVRDDRPLREAQAQLQMSDRLAAMGTVAAGVAHEINNPLSYVSSNIEFVLEELGMGSLGGEDVEEIKNALSAAFDGSERIRKIVKDLKRFTRSHDEGEDRIDVNRLVRSATAMLENELKHHAKVELDLKEIPSTRGDDAKLGQVFLNLIHNAAQAIPPGHASENRISVRSSYDPRGIVVEVEDTGEGISQENLARIFEAFYTTKPVGVGTGLGLAICHRVVSDHQGRIEVSSELGVGTTFRVVLPPVDPNDGAPAQAEQPAGSAPAPELAPLRILVIDDEIEVGESARRILGRKHQVDVVNAASEGLARMEATAYDVVLCDIMMPELTGMDFFRQVESEHPDLASRIVFMTGGVFSAEAESFVRHAHRKVLDKPLTSAGLREVVHDVAKSASLTAWSKK